MILALILGAALGAQAESPTAGPLGRFVICPGNVRCPPRPYGRPDRVEAGGPVQHGGNPISGVIANFIATPLPGLGSVALTFEADRPELTQEAGRLLDPVARRLGANPALEAVVEGFAGAGGDQTANVALAGRRAEAAAAYLAGRGIAAERILVLSWGETAAAETGAAGSVIVTLRRRPPAP